jgi:hypothetical protein
VTESEWLGCNDPQKMLEFLQGKASDRKLRLFAVACCRRVWHLLTHERSMIAVNVAELYADDLKSDEELRRASYAADLFAVTAVQAAENSEGDKASYARFHAAAAASLAATEVSLQAAGSSAIFIARATAGNTPHDPGCPVIASEGLAIAAVLRHIVGNPYRPVALINSTWLTPTVTTLAAAAYGERALPSGELNPIRLGVLADALEDAGCQDAVILEHLRGPGPHVRGCWVVDLLTGKS